MLSEKEKPGLWGEIYAARFMCENGYEIITANYRCRLGEIDIIAKKNGFLVFTEVKTRSPGAIAPGREAVGSAKQERIIETASLFMQKITTIFSRASMWRKLLSERRTSRFLANI